MSSRYIPQGPRVELVRRCLRQFVDRQELVRAGRDFTRAVPRSLSELTASIVRLY